MKSFSVKPSIKGFLLTFTLVYSAFICSFSQEKQRIEIPLHSEKDYFNVINLGESGALMLYGEGRSEMGIVFYNTDLEQQWSNKLEIDNKSQFIESFQNEGVVYLLFGNDNRMFFELVRVSCNIGLTQTHVFNSLPNFKITEFKVNEETAFLGGMIKNEPVILTIKIGDRTPRVISGGFREKANLQSIEFTNNGNILASYALSRRRQSSLVIKELTPSGKLVEQKVIEPPKGINLINGKLFNIGDTSTYLIGNYGNGITSNGLSVSQGIYIINNIELDSSVPKINFYSFTEFKSFFNFLSEKRQDKIEKLAKKKKSKGGDLKLSYNLLIHDLQKTKDGFLLVSDVFKPIIRTNNNNFYGSPFTSIYNPFFMSSRFYSRYSMFNSWAWNPYFSSNNNTYIDGFNYTHAFMVCFSDDGKIKWDNSIIYNDLTSYDLKEKISVIPNGDKFNAAYTDESKITFSQLDSEGNFVNNSTQTIKRENEKIKDTVFSESSYWYENNYIYWGYQKVRNDETGKRKVFFISKIDF